MRPSPATHNLNRFVLAGAALACLVGAASTAVAQTLQTDTEVIEEAGRAGADRKGGAVGSADPAAKGSARGTERKEPTQRRQVRFLNTGAEPIDVMLEWKEGRRALRVPPRAISDYIAVAERESTATLTRPSSGAPEIFPLRVAPVAVTIADAKLRSHSNPGAQPGHRLNDGDGSLPPGKSGFRFVALDTGGTVTVRNASGVLIGKLGEMTATDYVVLAKEEQSLAVLTAGGAMTSLGATLAAATDPGWYTILLGRGEVAPEGGTPGLRVDLIRDDRPQVVPAAASGQVQRANP